MRRVRLLFSRRWPDLAERWGVPVAVAVLLLVADQLSKSWVVRNLGPQPGSRQIFLFDDLVSLVYVQNTGIAFGLFRDLSPFFSVVALLISAAVVYAYRFYLPNRSIWVQLSVGLILGGALGNVIDRMRLSYVVDFIQVSWWPTFNLADSGITVGVLLLAFYLLLYDDGALLDLPDRDRPAHDDTLLRDLLATPPRQAPDDALLHDLLRREPPG